MFQKLLLIVCVVLSACAVRSQTRVPTSENPHENPYEERGEPGHAAEVVSAPAPAPSSDSGSAFEIEAPPELTVRSLCEPADARWAWPTKEQRAEAKASIKATCSAMGVSKTSCKYFLLVSGRESSMRWWVRHKMRGDVSESVSAYLSTSRRYGWRATWDRKSRKQADLSGIRLVKVKETANPYFPDVERWTSGGLGLGGVNVPYGLLKFDSQAPPEILCDPVVNVMAQITFARQAQDRYAARNVYEVQAVYAGRTHYDTQGRLRPLTCWNGCPDYLSVEQRERAFYGDRTIRKRCKAIGLDCAARLDLGKRLRRGSSASERYELAEEIRGKPLPPFDAPLPLDQVPTTVLTTGVVPVS